MQNRVEVYNQSDTRLYILNRGFDPYSKGWKFVGNPELHLWTDGFEKPSIRVQ